MARTSWLVLIFCVFSASFLYSQDKQQSAAPPPSAQPKQATAEPPDETNPPEEDESDAPKVYSFNPLQAKKEIEVGIQHMHRGKFKGAEYRFSEATKWDPTSVEAFVRLGEAEEKLKKTDAAKAAFERVIHLAPDSKQAHEAKKKLEQLKG